MDFGKIAYTLTDGNGDGPRTLRLTLIGQGDEDTLGKEGLAGLRRKRIVRLTNEARLQGALLSYEDLSVLLFTSLATLKRDVKQLDSEGDPVPLKGRRHSREMAG
jgi:hypothetical protein